MSSERRDFLLGAAGLAAFGALASRAGEAAMGKGPDALGLRDDGTYDTVELAKPAWTLGVMQSRVRTFDADDWKAGLQSNLDHMLTLIDKAFYYGARPDLLFFHEFPLSGWRRWTREEVLRFAIEIPGPETEAIAKKAREYGAWIVFGAYARDKDWPGHVLSITSVMSDRGEIVDKHWKARNIKGVFPGFELFTTTVYDVLDRYVEMYGRDAVIPVTRTPLGNLCTSSIQREPELFRAMAFKGAEVILRTASGGFTPMDIAATSLYNGTYTAIVNNSVSPDNGLFFDDAGSGGTAVYGPDGRAIAEADGKEEQLVVARIPIADLRARKRQPVVHMDLYRDVFDAYRSRYAPNLWAERVPDSLEDAAVFLKDKSRWR
ncbi:MAG: nitrilase-related carbon-nitrogen hydrolase [Pseudomonadota bacterium]|jgi:predicted amidohydrolase